ncbi:MAG: hypothetical protein OIF57_18990 [Marinobacterium sp.]|nr:hypothetical protein [Marinobacterium sp.]
MFSPIEVRFSPSRLGRRWLWLLTALALVAISFTSLPLFTRSVLALCALVVSLLVSVSIPFDSLRWNPRQGRVQVGCAGRWFRVECVSSILITPQVLFFRLDLSERYLSIPVTVWRDALSESDFRRLTVALRFARPPQLEKIQSNVE